MGSSARYFDRTFGRRVTGIDLTPDFVAASRKLGDLCGFGARLSFGEADARITRFNRDAFDHA